MSGGSDWSAVRGLKRDFDPASVQSREPQKPCFVSVRLSRAEKTQLQSEAAGESLSSYVRDRLFCKSKRAKAAFSISDQQALARVLRALAESNLALDLEALAQAAAEDDLPVEPLLNARLHEACDDIAEMRKDLIRALGLRPK